MRCQKKIRDVPLESRLDVKVLSSPPFSRISAEKGHNTGGHVGGLRMLSSSGVIGVIMTIERYEKVDKK